MAGVAGRLPWLQLAFRHVGRGGREASEEWRVRIEEDSARRSTTRCGPTEPRPSVGLRLGPVTVETRDGPVEISWAGRGLLLRAIRVRGTDEEVARALEAAEGSNRIDLDRAGKIVVFDALWGLFGSTDIEELLDPQLLVLQDRLKDEIASGS